MPEDQPQMPPADQPSEPQSTTTPAATEAQPAKQASNGAQILLGIVSCWLLLAGIAWFVVIGGLAAQAPAAGLQLALALIPIGLGVWVLVRRHKRGPGLGVGFLIGLVLIALGAGLCVSIIR
jgi:hypothetical protein